MLFCFFSISSTKARRYRYKRCYDQEMDQQLWEILVPAQNATGEKIALAHHQKWDERVREISGGMTILNVVKGQWLHPSGELFSEPMIPVRLIASWASLQEIITFTMEFYDQEAVMAYRVSDHIIVRSR